MADLYLMSGMCGAGKTTFAKKFAEEHNLVYICPDDFYKAFNCREVHENEFEVWIMMFNAIHALERDNISCIIDTNAPTIEDRCQFLHWFPSFKHHLIYIEATINQCMKNNQARERVIPDDEMAKIYVNFEPPKYKELLKWDSYMEYSNDENELTKVFNVEGENL